MHIGNLFLGGRKHMLVQGSRRFVFQNYSSCKAIQSYCNKQINTAKIHYWIAYSKEVDGHHFMSKASFVTSEHSCQVNTHSFSKPQPNSFCFSIHQNQSGKSQSLRIMLIHEIHMLLVFCKSPFPLPYCPELEQSEKIVFGVKRTVIIRLGV